MEDHLQLPEYQAEEQFLGPFASFPVASVLVLSQVLQLLLFALLVSTCTTTTTTATTTTTTYYSSSSSCSLHVVKFRAHLQSKSPASPTRLKPWSHRLIHIGKTPNAGGFRMQRASAAQILLLPRRLLLLLRLRLRLPPRPRLRW